MSPLYMYRYRCAHGIMSLARGSAHWQNILPCAGKCIINIRPKFFFMLPSPDQNLKIGSVG